MSEIVRDIITLPAPRITGREIAAEIAGQYGISLADLFGPSRRKAIAHPRQHAMWEVRRRAPHLSLPMIGALFGGRDHTTVLHGLKAYEGRLLARQVAA
jgi:chromosomal replication initiator protein